MSGPGGAGEGETEAGRANGTGGRRALVAAALGWALLSRLLVVALAWSGAANAPPPTAAQWESPSVAAPLARWDAGFYVDLAERGYSERPAEGGAWNVAFFPAYPLLVRATSTALGLEPVLAAVLLSNAAFLLAVPLAALAAAEIRGPRAGLLTGALVALVPGSAFASFPYTEGLFVLLVAAGLLLLGRGRLLGAALVAALATATRPTGIALAAAVFVAAWRLRRERPLASLLAPPLSLLGLLGYAAYLASRFGSPLLFVTAAGAPGWDRSPARALLEIVRAPVRSWYHLSTGAVTFVDLDPLLFAGALYLLLIGRRTLPREWRAMSAVGLLVPVLSGSYVSIGRYVFPLVPLWAAAAVRLEGAHRAVRWTVLALFAMALAWVSWRYGRWQWAG